MYVVILADNIAEANRHAKRHHLPRGRFRYAAKAATIRKLHTAEIHLLPGFAKRLDRHAILAELRWTKGKRRTFNVCGGEGTLLDVDRAAEVAFRYEAIKGAADGQQAGASKPSEDAAPAAPTDITVKRKTRSRQPAAVAPATAPAVAAPASEFL